MSDGELLQCCVQSSPYLLTGLLSIGLRGVVRQGGGPEVALPLHGLLVNIEAVKSPAFGGNSNVEETTWEWFTKGDDSITGQ